MHNLMGDNVIFILGFKNVGRAQQAKISSYRVGPNVFFVLW